MEMKNFPLTRMLRILLGTFFLFSAYGERSWGMGILGAVLLIQGILNVGCGFGAQSCAPSKNGKYSSDFDPAKSIRKLNY